MSQNQREKVFWEIIQSEGDLKEKWHRKLAPEIPQTVDMVGSRTERRYYLAKLDYFHQKERALDSIPDRKQKKKATLALIQEWNEFNENSLKQFIRTRSFDDTVVGGPRFVELMEGEEYTLNRPRINRTGESSSMLSVPSLEADRQTVNSSLGPETPRVLPRDIRVTEIPEFDVPDIEEEEFDYFTRETLTWSQRAERAMKSAKFKLWNVEDESQIVGVMGLLDAKGGFGEVFKGIYALKKGDDYEWAGVVVSKKNRRSTSVTIEDAKQLRKRMKYEGEIAKHLNHPNVTNYIGLFVEEGKISDELANFFLVSYFVKGGLARAYLAENRKPKVAEKLFRDLLDGLTYMHSELTIDNFHKQMICHGDLKGTNYLVEIEENQKDPKNPIITGKITDFGLSSILGSRHNRPSSQVGYGYRCRWQAPELARVKDDDIEDDEDSELLEKADVWSFALTSLEVVKNEDPFPMYEDIYPVWKWNPELLTDALPALNPVADLLSFHAFEVMKLCWKLKPEQRPKMIQAQGIYRELSNG